MRATKRFSLIGFIQPAFSNAYFHSPDTTHTENDIAEPAAAASHAEDPRQHVRARSPRPIQRLGEDRRARNARTVAA
ncbi:hypothetical protein EMIT0158MI4_140158 [Burkholderia ambifaria]